MAVLSVSKRLERLLIFLGLTFFFSLNASAQVGPIDHPAQWPQVPSGTGACSTQKTCADLAPALIQSALKSPTIEENLRHLTDSIGGRVTGSANAEKAVKWAVEAFRKAGLDARTEKFTIPAGWSEGATKVTVVSPESFELRAVSVGWSPATPKGGVVSELVDVGDGSPAEFSKAAARAKGKILLVHTKTLNSWQDLFAEYLNVPGIEHRARTAGATAILWMSTRPGLLLYRHQATFDGRVGDMPEAIVARQDAERIASMLDHGHSVRVQLSMPNHTTGPVESENVVSEIQGREKPKDFVLLGAHLDSWELGTGALDNGCNDAMVIDAARVIHSSGSIPRRSIRFVLFTGGEQGMLGSWAYARAHRSELDHMAAAIVFDEGVGTITGFSLGGRKDAVNAVQEALQPVKSLGVKAFTTDAFVGTDNFDFLLEGVPTLVANQQESDYLANYHAASDTFDKVDIPALKRQTAIAAVTAYALADAETRIAPRQSRAQIAELMKETGLDTQMKAMGLWAAWENGARGRELSGQAPK